MRNVIQCLCRDSPPLSSDRCCIWCTRTLDWGARWNKPSNLHLDEALNTSNLVITITTPCDLPEASMIVKVFGAVYQLLLRLIQTNKLHHAFSQAIKLYYSYNHAKNLWVQQRFILQERLLNDPCDKLDLHKFKNVLTHEIYEMNVLSK